ncbi:YceI family protein [Belliella pelovolcani]|uniref:Polyisoprenoid-binding protein YceI n=1 Tax=Belliella pelovolcani TaxID=529505 RepID=A0A1N7LHQ4_9BACT|nr:YceI family protein [Belliella pelovolcani]SIS73350.1 Polyisoprenoid-binding protein YceI [Belliella pelovolcani]
MDIGYLDIVVAPWRSLRILCARCVNPTLINKKNRLFLVFALVPFLLIAQSVKPESPIQFKIKNAGITVDGTISDWEVEVDFDPKKLSQSIIRGKANPESIQTGIKLRDKHLQGREYFHIQKFPFISLESKSFQPRGKNAFVGIFELQIRDVKMEVEIPFTLSQTGRQQKFKGEFIIDRLDFGLGEKSLVLSDEVRIFVEF